jgi:ribosomal protein S18 acetylase RimI-like enzyme
MSRAVSTRPERPVEDAAFLRAVYASTRPELAGAGWSAAELDTFIRMQHDAQARHYLAAFPDAAQSVIAVDGEPAGRLIVNRCEDEIRIVDIALLPQFRNAGVGRELVTRLVVEADSAGLPVRCHVLAGNQARRFWERAGFVAQEQASDSVYLSMERPCPTSLR